ncbi:PA14 domain-containing protein [Bacillus arachidis]|uniref:PA14 domain-containing protein n=1 Tax=Bacillus arachidis TaxID=2819290 RepID=UPI00255CDCAF|nr:PA14 domain-containing protein [Bacillus arachidis]WIY58772.1 PA14 domain-containing protein [Bacillus arachidis]
MVKLLKKSYSILMFVALLLFVTTNVHAEEKHNVNTVSVEKATQQAKNYFEVIRNNSETNWKESELVLDRKLYDENRELTAYLFVVQRGNQENGFIIVSGNEKLSGVLESTRQGANPYKTVDKERSIYVGPMSYLQKSSKEGSYIDLNTKKEVSKKALEDINIFTNSKNISSENNSLKKNSRSVRSVSAPYYNHKFISNVPDFDWTNGCLPTAYANVITYWANNGFPRLKNNQTDYEAYILDTLPKLMKTDAQGYTFGNKGIAGAKEYWEKTGKYSVSIKEYKNKPVNPAIFEEYKKEIDKNRPAIITTQTHPIYKNHAVTGVGYEEIFDPAERVWHRSAIVHDEWISTPQDHYLVWTPDIDNFYSIIPGADISSKDNIYKEKASQVHYNWGSGAPEGQKNDNFSAKFDQSQSLEAGDYFMQTLADDYVKVNFDGKKIIDGWNDSSSGQIKRALLPKLAQGNHKIETDFHEKTGNAGIFSDIVPFDYWLAYYYPNKDLQGLPVDARVIAPAGQQQKLAEDNGEGAPTSKVPKDNFSARYTTVKRLPKGEYIIRGKADDGLRVYIDGKLVIDRWHASGRYVEDARKVVINDNTGATILGKSTEKDIHLIEVQYLEEGGASKVEFGMEPYTDAVPFPHWTAEYYANKDLKGEAIVKGGKWSLDRFINIDFNWGKGSPYPSIPNDNFSARFTKLGLFENGNYEFEAKADDGVRVYIDDKRIIDSWKASAGEVRKVKVPMTVGVHKITVEYLEVTSGAVLKMDYRKVK